MTFTPEQVEALKAPLDSKVVKPPAPGKYGDYVEGWHVIAEANRIFGFDGWTRETVDMIEVCRAETEIGRNKDAGWMVGYRAKVRVTARGIIREGSAVGNGEARKLYDAIESAVKEAETDAMKRALMTFGNPFGLALYDKSKSNVVDMPPPPVPVIDDAQWAALVKKIDLAGSEARNVARAAGVIDLKEIPASKYAAIITRLEAKIAENNQQRRAA